MALATLAFWAAKQPFFSETLHLGALLLVILVGMAWRTVSPLPSHFKPGITLAQKPLLRWAVAGLGFKLSLGELAKIGGPALAVVTVCTFAALWFGWWIARRLAIGEKLGLLLGVGSSVCGASAIVAADSVVQSEKSDAACSLGIVTLLGTIGIVIYPLIGRALGMTDFQYGLWNGASLHEMAQVVAAGHGFSPGAEATATVVKLARICLLAPIVLYLAWMLRKQGSETGDAKVQAVPWFLVAFVVFVGINSIGFIPKETVKLINEGVLWLLCVGMAGVGLNSGFQDVKSAGWMPVLAGFLQWLFLAGLSLALAMALPWG